MHVEHQHHGSRRSKLINNVDTHADFHTDHLDCRLSSIEVRREAPRLEEYRHDRQKFILPRAKTFVMVFPGPFQFSDLRQLINQIVDESAFILICTFAGLCPIAQHGSTDA
jgi:hypothetical protein